MDRHSQKQDEAQCACVESTNKGVNVRWKDVTQTQQQRPESPTVTLTWHASKYKIHELHQRYIYLPLVEFMYLVFIWMPGESYRRPLRSLLLCLYDVLQALINSLVCWYITDINFKLHFKAKA